MLFEKKHLEAFRRQVRPGRQPPHSAADDDHVKFGLVRGRFLVAHETGIARETREPAIGNGGEREGYLSRQTS